MKVSFTSIWWNSFVTPSLYNSTTVPCDFKKIHLFLGHPVVKKKLMMLDGRFNSFSVCFSFNLSLEMNSLAILKWISNIISCNSDNFYVLFQIIFVQLTLDTSRIKPFVCTERIFDSSPFTYNEIFLIKLL